jgi:hypothetical protein
MNAQKENNTKHVLEGIVRDTIQNCSSTNNEKLTGSELEEITEKVANHFLRTIPLHPEGGGQSFRITIRSGGIGDGSSIKAGNIWLNWKHVLIEGSESILSIAGAVAVPWLVPLAGLVVCNRIWSLLRVPNRLKMNQDELTIILKDLEGMKCIEKTEGNKWRLRELVRVV